VSTSITNVFSTMADSISIEETNKIRAAIGLPLLPVPGASSAPAVDNSSDSGEEDPGSTLESRQAESYANWKRLEDEAEAKAKRDAKNQAIKKARDAAKRFAKMDGKGLGEAEDDEQDTRAWLKGQKKRQKQVEKARRLEQELAEREQQAQYTAEDLAGVKVGHELDEFEEGGEQVLTLKDTTIDENEEDGDELENVDLKEREKLSEKLDLKRKRPVYDPNDLDDEKKSILAHYDEDIDGKKRKRFTLDGFGATEEEKEAFRTRIGQKSEAQTISLDILPDAPVSDYHDISQVTIKKPKKKKAKSTRQKAVDEDDILAIAEEPSVVEAMEVDSGNTKTALKPRLDNTSFIDDEDLQASLATQRRLALKKRKRTRPEDIARQLREEASATPDAMKMDPDSDEEEGGLVIDETSEFVANLQKPTIPTQQHRPSQPSTTAIANSNPSSPESDVDMKDHTTHTPETSLSQSHENALPAQESLTSTGLESDTTLSTGIGATLSMLTQRGLLSGSGTTDLNAIHRERQRFLAEKHKREAAAEARAKAQRERDRASGKLDRMTAREREEYARWENKQRDQQESRQIAEVFNKEYKPNVELKYIDEYGRSMGSKEAFRHLSHQFHGKGSGKGKTEKKLKKIEDEKLREKRGLDSNEKGGYDKAMGVTARKRGQAGVRLA
jgi:U4/U6.U5 tri-snRNP-associated protein 1